MAIQFLTNSLIRCVVLLGNLNCVFSLTREQLDSIVKAIFEEAADNSKSLLIPDGQYTFERKKNQIVQDNQNV